MVTLRSILVFLAKCRFSLTSCLPGQCLLLATSCVLGQGSLSAAIMSSLPSVTSYRHIFFLVSGHFSQTYCLLGRWSLPTVSSFVVTPHYFKFLHVEWISKRFSLCSHILSSSTTFLRIYFTDSVRKSRISSRTRNGNWATARSAVSFRTKLRLQSYFLEFNHLLKKAKLSTDLKLSITLNWPYG